MAEGTQRSAGPARIVSMTFASVDEVVEAVEAVDVLGLGCELRNEWRPTEPTREGQGHEMVWVLDLYESPVVPTGTEGDDADA